MANDTDFGPLFAVEDDTPHYHFRSLTSGSCGNCSILGYKDDYLILDAGLGIRLFQREVKRLGIQDQHFKGLLITHNHADHIRAAAPIAQKYCITIYTTPEVCHTLRYNRRISGDITAYLRPIEAEKTFRVGEMEIRAFDVPHDAIRNVGFTITSPAGVFSLITDIGSVTPRITKAIRDSNFLIFESNYDEQMLQTGAYPLHLKKRITGEKGHISNQVSAETIAENYHSGLKFIALCHLSGENNIPDLALKTVSDRLLRSEISVDEDLKLALLKRREPSPLFKLRNF